MLRLLEKLSVDIIDDRYRAIDELSAGMGASSFKGVDETTGATVFMKYLLFPSNNYELAKFKTEILLSERLTALPLVSDSSAAFLYSKSFYDDNVLCLITEWVDAPSLNIWLDEHVGISLDERLELVHRICSAVGGLCNWVFHRDLHPGNILIEDVDLDWHSTIPACGVKVVDLGEAVPLFDASFEESEQFVFDVCAGAKRKIEGSFYGLPPEVFRPWEVIERNHIKYDVWSISLLIYKILTGKDLILHPDLGSYKVSIDNGSLNNTISNACNELRGLDIKGSLLLSELFSSMCKVDVNERTNLLFASRVLWDIRIEGFCPTDMNVIRDYLRDPGEYIPEGGWQYSYINDPN
ncbi:protein kinase [Cobetia sp. SIMBA_158]|uniref:protein kinase domain-containing protein n=1 Tax=Cobetia sp. SIMBA_158 TaxID=3081617 RepID=UPI00397FF02E